DHCGECRRAAGSGGGAPIALRLRSPTRGAGAQVFDWEARRPHASPATAGRPPVPDITSVQAIEAHAGGGRSFGPTLDSRTSFALHWRPFPTGREDRAREEGAGDCRNELPGGGSLSG